MRAIRTPRRFRDSSIRAGKVGHDETKRGFPVRAPHECVRRKRGGSCAAVAILIIVVTRVASRGAV